MRSRKIALLMMVVTVCLAGCGSSGKEASSSAASSQTTAANTSKAQETMAATTPAAIETKQTSAAANTTAASGSNVVVTLAAAASLKNVFDKTLIPDFEKKNPGITITATYDSSGKLQTQIEQGLEADIFFSAAEKQMKALEDEGIVDRASETKLLLNKLVMIVPKDSKLNLKEFADVEKADTIAIGDPASVPAGQYTQEALTSLGVWDKIQAKVSKGTNVTEVLNQVAAGSADVGFVYATDAASMADKVKVICEAPEGSLKNQVVYPVAVLKKAPQKTAADKFMDYIQSDEAMKAFTEFGFTDNRTK